MEKDLGVRVRTFSVRINECLLGYVMKWNKFHDTSIFAAYVNEENPMIDQLLYEALQYCIVNRFLAIE